MALAAPANQMHERVSTGKAIFILTLAVLGAASMTYYHLALFMPRVHDISVKKNLAGEYSFGIDFYPVWLTARRCLPQRCDPYSQEMTREIQSGIFGRPLDPQISTDPLTDYRTFAYPAFTDLLFWPASQLPFSVVRVLCALLLGILTIAGIVLWLRALAWRVDLLWIAIISLLVLASYQVLEGLYADQLGLLVGFLLAASLLALQRGRLLLAGILLALTTIKPQMTALAIFFLLIWSLHDWNARRRFVVGFFSLTLVLTLIALAVWPHWIASWARVVLGYHRYARPPLVSEVLAAPFGPGIAESVTFALTVILLITAVWLAWRHRGAAANSRSFWITLNLLLGITSVTLLPGQALHDHVILLPGIFLLSRARTERPFGRVETVLFTAGAALVLWPWITAFILIVLRPLLSAEVFYSKAVFALPLRTTAAFPFVVLGLLTLALRRTQVANDTLPSLPR
jgi:hypothetical protein